MGEWATAQSYSDPAPETRRLRRRRPSVVLTAVLASLSLLLTACTGSADASTNGAVAGSTLSATATDQLDAALADAMTLSGASGAIAGVWAPWAGHWVTAAGTTTMKGDEPMSTGMRFRIGANTRSMTCTVLLRLVDEGTVELNDPVTDYLERTPGVDGITLGQLCQGTSGLAGYRPELVAQFVNNPTRQWPALELVSSALASTRAGSPGSTWRDSDGGYVLLGMALEAATHKDWATLYQKYIVNPLHLEDTNYPGPAELAITGSHPHGYATTREPNGKLICGTVQDVTDISTSMAGVSGGVVSNLADMKTWSEALASGTLLSTESKKKQWTTVAMGANAPSWQGYGLGAVQIGPFRGESGAITGFSSAMLSDPVSGLTVVVMLNNSSSGTALPQHLAQRLASIAAKLPPVKGETAPLIEMPWSEAQMVQAMKKEAVCQAPATPAPKA
jgi:D-alanyl-D-alanine carboxypeptidase